MWSFDLFSDGGRCFAVQDGATTTSSPQCLTNAITAAPSQELDNSPYFFIVPFHFKNTAPCWVPPISLSKL